MKILWLTEFFPASDNIETTGGVEARCYFVARDLKNLGHSVEVIADRTYGSRWSHLSLKTLFTGLPYYLRLLVRSVQALDKDFDLVEGTNYTTYPFAWFIGMIRHKPVVFWYPDVFLGQWLNNIGPAGVIGEFIERLILKLPVAKYIAISESTRTKLIKAGIPANKIELIYCGVDFNEIEKINKVDKQIKYDLISVARLVSYKRVIDLVKATNKLRTKFPNIRLAIVGQGPERRKLERIVANSSLRNNIDFLGYIPRHQDVLLLMSESRVFCLPSIAEGFGIVAIEAAEFGIPTVLSDIPVLREVTQNGQGGLYFKPKNPIDLANNLKRLLTNHKLYEQKSKSATKLAEKYDWRLITKQTEGVYKSLL